MLEKIISTLNSIEVHGKDNLDKLLGCIMVLEDLEAELANNKVKTEDNADG